jgi:ParB-like chromosome segregation protein Spo0J
METIRRELKEVELRFIQHFVHLRLQKPPTWQRLFQSIQTDGQRVPIIVVPGLDDPFSFILIDGYLRVNALKRCEQERVYVEVWHCGLAKALLGLLTGLQQRSWDVIEEALLIREVMSQGEYSVQSLAKELGRDPSFIYRRLELLSEQSDDILMGIKRGYLSSWAAVRIIAPLARANANHAMQLIEHLKSHRYSTRQLHQFYQHYQRNNHAVRNHMITHPDLFFKSLQREAQLACAKKLAQGPEGEWEQSLVVMNNTIKRMGKLVESLFGARQRDALQQERLASFARCERAFLNLTQTIRSQYNDPH